ncbi:Di-sulfide bridge nucleocytoplasmic transport domain-containing protein [Lipomyces chichibuensis]|uniref:Di-sulfide bridge nucleocytoplasmic transport domain-containing protein n=1 Tax=Lipomyces chichibuensis TaxID=1546026 RepID=UPI00334313C3
MDTMDFSPADRTPLLRGHETPMDFTYHSAGPAMDATSPFREAAIIASAAASSATLPGSFSQKTQRVSDQTPYFTPRTTSFAQTPFTSSLAYQSNATSPLYGRGILMKPVAQSPRNLIDEDVVMLSSPASPTPTKQCIDSTCTGPNDASDSEKVTESTSSKFLKAFRSNSASNSSSPLAKAKQLLSLSSRKKNSTQKSRRNKVKYHNESDDSVIDEGGDDSDATSDWSGGIVVKLRSPRKVSSSRIRSSPGKASRSLPGGNLVNADNHNASLLAFLSRHDNLPFVFASYLQLIFNVFLVLVMLYLIMSFVLMIRHDISRKIEEYTDEAAAKIEQCTNDYLVNGCMPGSRVPALEDVCNAWQNCMNRRASDVGRARVSAQTVAEIVNSFIEPISYKTMLFVLVLLFGSLYVSSSKVTPSTGATAQQHQLQERIIYHPEPAKSKYAGALPPPQANVK